MNNDGARETVELELLLLRCRRNDGQAMEQLIRRYERPLYYFIRRLVGSEADAWDALQLTWMRVLRGVHRVRNATGLKAWLYRVARTTALNYLRDEQRHRHAVQEKVEQAPTADAEPFAAEDAQAVHAALDQLDLPFREALTLYFLEELSVRQIAEVLEIPEGTAKSRLFHGRKKLRQILEKNYG